ncbi:MAG: glycosyltransferase [Micrococcaceae bacterium]
MTQKIMGTISEPKGKKENWRVIQRVILPDAKDTDVIPLYIDSGVGYSNLAATMDSATENVALGSATSSGDAFTEAILDKRSMIVALGDRVSFATYFNAFPASYWRRWTSVEKIQLVVKTEGEGTVAINRSNAKGSQQRVDSFAVKGQATTVVDLNLKPFGDGGWYWFDLVAKAKGFKLVEAHYQTIDNGNEGSYSLGITTFNRPDYCAATAKVIADNDDIRGKLKEIIIVDQGTQKVQDEDGFDETAEKLGNQLKIINQKNVGGSGGFSRAMYEASENSDADYLILLDDDIMLEPESFLRQTAFADYSRRPTIVGGHFFDLYNRPSLYVYGETIDHYRFLPAKPNEVMAHYHDFSSSSLRETPWLHRRYDVDYNGWWMCLIPTKIIRDIGLSLPVFIKWDDMEYGLRAKEAGYPTVSLPGAAIWHISWADKDDATDWQAYFHIRNRIITSLLHSDFEMGGRLVRETQYEDIKHLVSMQYYTQTVRNMGYQDLIQGPDQLHDLLTERLPEVRGLAKNFPDSTYETDPEAFPMAKPNKPRKKPNDFKHVWGIRAIPVMGKALARQLSSAFKSGSTEHPEANIAHQDAKWYRLAQYDSVVVTNAEGTASSWYRRDSELLQELGVESANAHAKLLKEWPRLRKEYREALSEITSTAAWKKTFDKITEE